MHWQWSIQQGVFCTWHYTFQLSRLLCMTSRVMQAQRPHCDTFDACCSDIDYRTWVGLCAFS